VEEFTDKAPHYEIGVDQGEDFKIIEPPQVYLMPVKKGKDFCAQIEDGDLFNFNRMVMPILQVLCGKTLEHSRMEVLEEEELRVMREQQAHYEKLRKDEIAEGEKLELVELRKKQDIDRKKA
jgi:radial spoke head protein 3